MVVMKNYLRRYSRRRSRRYRRRVGSVGGGGEVKFLLGGNWVEELVGDSEGLDCFYDFLGERCSRVEGNLEGDGGYL